jgi:CO dehydrogenase nickel-insertion accessory protein CooC1
MDTILGVLDYTLESASIAKRMVEFCAAAKFPACWLILNKVRSADIQSMPMAKLEELQARLPGVVSNNRVLKKRALRRGAVGLPGAR